MTDKQFYTVEKEINGVKYVAQFNGLSEALKAVDNAYIPGTDTISNIRMAQYVFDKVIVEPKVKIDDFDNLDDMNEVMIWAQGVMQGNFRPATEQTESKTKGKK